MAECLLRPYASMRERMEPGDIIAFSGRGPLSLVIKLATWHPISHLGIVSHYEDFEGRKRVYVTESTSLDGHTGVFTRYMSEVVETYHGRVYWLPLGHRARARCNVEPMQSFIQSQQGKPYDFIQCLRAGFKAVTGFNLSDVEESSKSVFCSEYCAFAHEHGGVWDFHNPSLVTPRRHVVTPIFAHVYIQLSGRKLKPLRKYGEEEEK